MARTISTIRPKKTKIDDPFNLPEARPILRLIEAKKEGQDLVENCYFCQLPIEMETVEKVTFKWQCPCGKSDGFLNGI